MHAHQEQACRSRRRERSLLNRDPLAAVLRPIELSPQQFRNILLQLRQICAQLKFEGSLAPLGRNLLQPTRNRDSDRLICNAHRVIHRRKREGQILTIGQRDTHFPAKRELLVGKFR